MSAYLIWVAPPLLVRMWAQHKVKSAFAAGEQIPASCGLTGAETAQAILDANNITNVGIEETPGRLSDHYAPKAQMLRLSTPVYQGRSLSSLGVAAHEVGHAIQDAKRYGPLVLRNGIVPFASTGARLSMIVIVAGAALQAAGLIVVGIALFGLTVLFQLINLPVEFDASSRARKILLDQVLITSGEDKGVGRVLNAAAMTYVAATVTSISTMMYYVARYIKR